MPPSTSLSSFHAALASSKRIIAVCGAGLSAASGIPTFRGAGGLWRSFDAMSLATPEAFYDNPSLVWQFYHYRREKARQAQPNKAHRVLAALSVTETLKRVAPNAESFALITQNIDGLSPRAIQELGQPSSAPLYEMHGRLFATICTKCDHREVNTASPICPALAGNENFLEKGPDRDIPLNELPQCAKDGCGGLLRPDVVWFGEVPYHLPEIGQLVDAADLCLVVGTSSTVYPAAAYSTLVAKNGGKVAVFNLERSSGDSDADFLFLGPCEETLAQAMHLENL